MGRNVPLLSVPGHGLQSKGKKRFFGGMRHHGHDTGTGILNRIGRMSGRIFNNSGKGNHFLCCIGIPDVCSAKMPELPDGVRKNGCFRAACHWLVISNSAIASDRKCVRQEICGQAIGWKSPVSSFGLPSKSPNADPVSKSTLFFSVTFYSQRQDCSPQPVKCWFRILE